VLFAVGVGAPLSGLVLGYVMARSLHHSIYQLSVRIRDAAGRLNREVASVTLDEKNDLHALNGQMQRVLVDIERVVEQLQQREREVLRAEQLAAVGQVAAGIAHELRNPLTSVKMLVQTGLEGETPRGLPADDLGIIEGEVRRMEQTIQTFLDLARPPRSERRKADLAEVLRRSVLLLEGRAKRQKVMIDLGAFPDSLSLEIDPEQVHQVVVNLLLNALDVLPRGGTVSVSAARTPGGKEVEVRVQDNGPGIAPRIKERLFEPFVSSKETGLGLGLSICKRLIEAHGGTIRGDNLRGGGALFTFTLPT
jgi:signal transduction histidine kinase